MKPIFIYFFGLIILGFSACKEHIAPKLISAQDPEYILSNFNNFWTYWYLDVRLSENFVPYNANDSIVSKDYFLRAVSTGAYLPVKLKVTPSAYQLYKINDPVDPSITEEIKRFGKLYVHFFQMQGKPFPEFNLVDINGNVYNKKICKGKIVVLNFWFIGCSTCRKEIPDLNKLVASYKNRKDVVFISIAPDKSEDLKNFLAKTPFNYAAVSDINHLTNKLNIQMFPTQVIINRKGQIARVPEDYQQLEKELKNELLKHS